MREPTGAVGVTRDQHPVPALATSWEISGDGTLYRFHLDPRATFVDGAPVLASDVVFTLRRIADPASRAVQTMGSFVAIDLARTKAVDEHTVEVAFRAPLAAQLASFHDVFVLPEHVYAAGDFHRDFGVRAVGSGPYRLTRREPGKELRLERRRDYWGDRPHIQTVVFKIVSDHATAFQALKLGQLDESRITSDQWLHDRTDAALQRTLDFRAIYTLNYNFIAWNNRHPILRDPAVRRALAMCIPRDTIIRGLFGGTARPVTGPFTPGEWACNPAVNPVPYDLPQAQRILAERGWMDHDGDGTIEKNGAPLKFDFVVISGNTASAQIAQILQGEWKKVGIAVRLVTLDGAAAIQRVVAGNYDAAYLGWNLDPDPDPYALFHSSQMPPRGQNVVFYENRQADDLMDRARRELDPGKRRELYWQLHGLLANDQPYAWLVQVSSKWVVNKRVRGIQTSPTMELDSWYPGALGWRIADQPLRSPCFAGDHAGLRRRQAWFRGKHACPGRCRAWFHRGHAWSPRDHAWSLRDQAWSRRDHAWSRRCHAWHLRRDSEAHEFPYSNKNIQNAANCILTHQRIDITLLL